MESKIPHEGSRQNTKELTAALGVIRKIMKMDAAGPFNAPVNPVALGIPDYFEIIDTPMDFGSICQDLENGTKYMNSHDVYTDVQFIWDNCYKYNNKGDYILDLMKRVKKNFMKYWSAAGLLTEISTGTQVEHVMWPHQGKSTSKIKSKHKRRRYGIDGHKSTCLCAVCVVRRRRKEREELSAAFESHLMVDHTSSPNEPKLEVISADKPCSEGTASSLDHSPEADGDAEMDDAGKVETATTIEPTGGDELERLPTRDGEIELCANAPNNETHDNIPHGNGPSNQHSCDPEFHHSNSSKHSDKKDEDEDHEEDDNEIQQGELRPSGPETAKLLENPAQQENQSVLWLCRELFPGEQKSVWNGPHSLIRRQASASGKQYNAIRSALATIMNS
ncbi:Transcription factor GTE6 [Platanthera zijinensis]|uniref:Transcription factor GTE6 n=1 Tax=Platanthera zijinensis TaxID=2320716 RepID=A0AAP0B3M6_9ASPA